MRLLLLAPLLVLAACQPAAKPEAKTEAAPSIPPAPQPGPGGPAAVVTKPAKFSALSKTAEDTTGSIELSQLMGGAPTDPPHMRLEAANGVSYETSLIEDGATKAKLDWSGIFKSPIDLNSRNMDDPTVDVHLIAKETVPPKTLNGAGGFCGKDKTYALAIAFPIGVMNGAHMGIAAFKGTAWPPKDASALCGVYEYSPATPQLDQK